MRAYSKYKSKFSNSSLVARVHMSEGFFEHRMLKLEINDKFVTEPVELYGGSQRGPVLIKPWVNWSNRIGRKKCL